MRIKKFFAFVQERHNIYLRRQSDKPKPWTKDPILRKFRFTNVYRELDPVTIWIRKHWSSHHIGDGEVWFAMVVARLFNQPAMLEELGYPVPYCPAKIYHVTQERKERGERNFNAAYIVSTNGRSMEKEDYLVQHVLTPLWKGRENFTGEPTLSKFHQRLMRYTGMGGFLAGQVVADTKFTALLKDAPDWWTWAASGPGSRRGLNRVAGTVPEAPWREEAWLATLTDLNTQLIPLLKKAKMPRLSAQDLQNCCCEWDKYERVRLGEGRPKQLYPGAV